MNARGSLVLVVLLSQLALGCGGGHDDPAPIARDDFADALSRVYCQTYGPCCRSLGFVVDEGSCPATLLPMVQKMPQLTSTGVRYDPAAASRCLDALASALADCSLSSSENLLGGAACRAVFVPLRKLGESCASSQECAPVGNVGVNCSSRNGDGTCELGVLAGAPHGDPGDACSASCDERSSGITTCGSTTNATGVTCFASEGVTCVSGACRPLPGVNEACELTCQEGLYCDGTAGICRNKLASGSPCSAEYSCTEGACEDGVCGPQRVSAQQCESFF